MEDPTSLMEELKSSVERLTSSEFTRTKDRMTNQIVLSVTFSTDTTQFDVYELQDKIEEVSQDIVDVDIAPVLSVQIVRPYL
ncbi:hypothetical protein OAV88_02795 [bacterium]|nr:hypothetical protein [bacterium]